MSSVSTMDVEQDNLMEVGSYLHRASPAITELQSSPNPPRNLTQILQSVSNNVNLAKDLVAKCTNQTDLDEENKILIQQLEQVIHNIGEDLGKIPVNTFDDNRRYAGTAIASLSQEMRYAHLQMSGRQQDNSEVLSVAGSTMQEPQPPRNIPTNEYMPSDPRIRDFLRPNYYSTPESGPEHVEPLYDSFFCPLTKKLMSDPVTIESGVTYERKAIAEYFEKFEAANEPLTCPVTGMTIQSKVLNTNVALKAMIGEWAVRNEAMRIRIAGNELIRGNMALDAIQELKSLAQKRKQNRDQMHSSGITKMLSRFLESNDMAIRCEMLELLSSLAEDDEGKDIIAKSRAIQRTVKLISSNSSAEKHAALSFLLELSKSEGEFMVRMIGHTSGAILILVTMKFNESADQLAAEKAGEILKNLEKRPKNIKYMALNGYIDPLLTHLVEGTEEMQMEMVSYLGELVLKQDISITIAAESRACEALIRMVRSSGSADPSTASGGVAAPNAPLVRKATFDVLVQISSLRQNAAPLIAAGVVPVMIEELFLSNVSDGDPIPPKIDASAVIANLLESVGPGTGLEPENIQVNKNGHTLISQYTIYNFAHMLKLSMPDQLNINLIRIMLSLSTLPKPLSAIVAVVRENEVIHTVIEFLNSPSEQLIVVVAKLLCTLSPYIGHTIAERLCKTQGQPGNLVKNLDPAGRVSERQSESANLLAKLPHQNITLNLYLFHQGTMPLILYKIEEMHRGGALTSRYAKSYMEGLVGILVRFTTTMYDPEIQAAVMENNLTQVFTELLVRNAGSDDVLRLSCIGLMNLSSHSVNLSKPAEERRPPKKKGFLGKMLTKNSIKELPKMIPVCPVHRGICSASATFCLVEAGAVERLLGCVESDNGKVVGAALGALSTLLDDRVDVDRGVEAITNLDGVRRVLRVLREHREESLWYKAFWIIERCLLRGGARSVNEISTDRVLPGRLITAFQSGDVNTKQVADNLLRRLHRMPDYSMSFVSMEM